MTDLLTKQDVLKVDQITFGYTDKKLFENFSFTVKRGENILLTGSNGSGKSTLIELICGLKTPEKGKIMINNIIIENADTLPTKCGSFGVAVVFQNPHDNFISPVVQEEVAFAFRNMKKKNKKEAVEKILKSFDIVHLQNRAPQSLSGGEAALVAIASAMAQEPDLLILDETLAGLDEENKKNILDSIFKASEKKGTSLIYVSHRDEDVMQFDQMISLDGKEKEQLKNFTKLPAGEKILKVDNLKIEIGKTTIVQNFSFEAAAGEVVFLRGQNGSGKTTVLNSINGFAHFSGNIEIAGQKLTPKTDRKWLRQNVAFLLQSGEIAFSKPSVREEVEYKIKNLDLNVSVNDFLQEMHLSHLADKNPTKLSGGEQRLVALASVLVGEPKLICLDEVFCHLDHSNCNLVIDLLNNYRSMHTCALVIVEHAEELCTGGRTVRLQKFNTKPVIAAGKNITLGKYAAKDTIIHKMPATIKLLIVIWYIVMCFVFDNYYILLGLFGFFVIALILAKTTLVMVFSYLKYLLVLTAAIFGLNFLTSGLQHAFLIFTRLMLVNLFAPLLSLTTTPYELSRAIYYLFYPFKWLGLPIEDFALSLSLTLAFLPEFYNESQKIRKMQMVRGADFKKRQLIKRVAAAAALFVPIILFAIESSRRKAMNLVLRGYGLRRKRI